jgi:hypothetical protein
MIDKNVTEDLIKHFHWLQTKIDLGQRKAGGNGDPAQQFTGMIGECIVRHELGLDWMQPKDGWDNGIDLEKYDITLDVKTMGRNVPVRPNFTNNFWAWQDKFKFDGYVFCSYNKKLQILTICGWQTKSEFIERRRFKPKGTMCKLWPQNKEFPLKGDMYEIDMCDIKQFDNIDQLKDGLQLYNLTKY